MATNNLIKQLDSGEYVILPDTQGGDPLLVESLNDIFKTNQSGVHTLDLGRQCAQGGATVPSVRVLGHLASSSNLSADTMYISRFPKS